jgi:ABC-type lipoprotein export system ATPase subunit
MCGGSRSTAAHPGVHLRDRTRGYGESASALEAEGLIKSVGEGRAARRLVNGVDLTVQGDEIVAVLGRSGAGKSMLLHLLGGLDAPDRGRLTLAGELLTRCSSRAMSRIRLRHIGFVFQQFQLIEELSGLENVLVPTRLPGAPGGGARRAVELVDELGLTPVARHRPHERLSAAMLAAAIVIVEGLGNGFDRAARATNTSPSCAR